MENLKVKVNNKAEAFEAQDLFEKLGYKKEAFKISDFPKCVVTDHWHIDGEIWWYSCGAGYPCESVLYEELSLEELRTLATPRLYLDPHNNYAECCVLVPQEHWIEVPDGAEIALEPAVTKGVAFYKDGFKFFYCESSLSWEKTTYNPENLAHWKSWRVLWQRPQQPESLPFVDDETLGEKLKSIEVARQELKGVDATLAERESTYGSFEDVARTTGQLMAVILNSKNGQTLPYAHEEALHMICSKIARIVNGDCNHLDSWHDIGGYSKLIEDIING